MDSVFYFDSSVALRILLKEKGISPKLSEVKIAVSSEIIEIELMRTLETACFSQRINQSELASLIPIAMKLIQAISRTPVHRPVIEMARSSFAIPVKSLDAIHIATAEWLRQELGQDIIFWTHDQRQGQAAMTRGFQVRGI